MKLVCIADLKLRFEMPGARCPQMMERVTAIREERRSDGLFYELAEYPPIQIGNKRYIFIFIASAFAEADGPDERERLEAYRREQLAIEGKLFQGIAEILAAEEPMPQDAFDRSWAVIQERLKTTR